MARIYPNSSEARMQSDGRTVEATVLTVWNKSLLFGGDGFTVFDSAGDLVYRVENYASSNKGHIVLMDAVGKPLFTIRRKKLTLSDQWVVHRGEEMKTPMFCVKKHSNLVVNSKVLAHVTSMCDNHRSCTIEGTYSNRSCAIYDDRRRLVAEIKRKEVAAGGARIGDDVFRLMVEAEFDPTVAMALVVLLAQMF